MRKNQNRPIDSTEDWHKDRFEDLFKDNGWNTDHRTSNGSLK